MTKFIEKQASTVEEAIRLAQAEIAAEYGDGEYTILEQRTLEMGKKGFFGIGYVPAKVRVVFDVAVYESAPAPAPAAEEIKEEPAAPAQAPAAEPAPTAPIADADMTPAQTAKSFIDGLLAKMSISGEAFIVEENEAQILIDIRGEDMGAVIGRRGDTLDAIQYLTSLSINRGREDHIRITLDTEGYRAKREESLQRLARKMAGKVLKYRKNMTLEPMNPYERRIIHAALQDYNGVTTYSTGTEPNRRVVVAMERGNGGRTNRGPRPRRRYDKKYEDKK